MSRVICVRKTDGAVFQLSTDDARPDDVLVAELVAHPDRFVLRRVEPFWVRRWLGRPRRVWRRTGEIWSPRHNEYVVTSTDVEFEK